MVASASASLTTDLWSQFRSLADDLDLELSVAFTGRAREVPGEARALLWGMVDSLLESARTTTGLHHLGLDVAYLNDGSHVRLEHDGALEPAVRSRTESAILAAAGSLGALGGSVSLSSGRGFGLRVEAVLPYSVPSDDPPVPSRAISEDRLQPAFSPSPVAFTERLTTQEQAVLSLLALGLSNKEIAAQMGLSVGTVKFHLAQVYQKLDVQGRGRGAAVARARDLGLIFD